MSEKFFISPETPDGQRKAITASDKIITVGAGAGTGKTWVLSNRYVRLLIENDEVLPRDILTLTYTEAAAGEMKQRIEGRLRDVIKELGLNDKDRDRVRELTDGFADSWISTIHAFSTRLIRESGLSLDIDPRASVITSQQEQDFWDSLKSATEFADMKGLAKAYCEKNIQDLAASLDSDKNLSRAVNKWKSETLSELARRAAEIHASSGYSWEDMLSWSENNELIDRTWPHVRNIVRMEWQEVWQIWSKVILPDNGKKKPSDKEQALIDLLSCLNVDNLDDDALKNFYVNAMESKDISGGKGKFYSALKTALGGLTLSAWRKTRKNVLLSLTKIFDSDVKISEQERELRKTLLKFCAVSWAIWDVMKKKRGLLSFSDMILHAKRAITEGGVKRRFSHILVDEFQDTDPLQFNMIESLAGDETSLFAVGDPKQSIYKFRNAEPALFASTIKKADDSGTRVELDTSFRTRALLLEYINKLFASIWKNGLGSSDSMAGLRYESLNPPLIVDEERDSGTMPELKIFLARHGQDSKQARKDLAENLAKNIAQWVREGRTIWDKEKKKIRAVNFSDFAILSRSRNIYETLEEALAKFNIPSVQDKSTDYFSRGEVNDVICTLRAAADFHDDFSVMGWLMSPFSEVKLDEAVRCLESLTKDFRPIDAIQKFLPKAYSRLEYLALVGEHEGPAGLLSEFDKDRKWLSCYKESDRLRVLRNLRSAVSISENFQNSGTAGLIACAEWLGRAVRRKNSNIEEPSWHDKNENAVLLSVVHSAKGLEYPVTVIFESRVQKSNNDARKTLRASRELGIVFKDLPDELKTAPDLMIQGADWDSLLSEQGEAEEETRLFYVAATRAQDSLIYCGMVKDKDDSPDNGTWTKILLEHDKDTTPEYVSSLDGVDSLAVKDSDSQRVLKPASIVKAQNFLRQVSASSFALFEFCPFAWRRRYRQGMNLTWESPDRDLLLDEDFAGGAGTGSLAHWILAKWPKGEDYEAELDNWLTDRRTLALLPGSLRGVWRDKKSKEALKEWLLRFAESERGKKLIHTPNMSHEQRYRVRLDGNTSMAGAFDAYYQDGDSYTVIDYKITEISKAPPGLYESQMDFYALAIHELTKTERVNNVIAFLKENEFTERVCEDFESIRQRVLYFAKSGACGPYDANTKNCALCPFKKGCAKHAG